MDVFAALQFDCEREQEFTATPTTTGHLRIRAYRHRAFAAGNQRDWRLYRMMVLLNLLREGGIYFCHFACFAGDAVAEDHRRDAVLLKKRPRHG